MPRDDWIESRTQEIALIEYGAAYDDLPDRQQEQIYDEALSEYQRYHVHHINREEAIVESRQCLRS